MMSGMGVPGRDEFSDPRALDGLLAAVRFTEQPDGTFVADAAPVLLCQMAGSRVVHPGIARSTRRRRRRPRSTTSERASTARRPWSPACVSRARRRRASGCRARRRRGGAPGRAAGTRANESTVNTAPSLRIPGALPLVGPHRLPRRGVRVPGGDELVGHHGGVLPVVAVLDRGHVLVPVREARRVGLEHQPQPLVEQPEHVAHVAPVLERRPLVVGRPQGRVRMCQQRRPRIGVAPGCARPSAPRRPSAASKPQSGHSSLEHPRPVLVVRHDRHPSGPYRPHPSRMREVVAHNVRKEFTHSADVRRQGVGGGARSARRAR